MVQFHWQLIIAKSSCTGWFYDILPIRLICLVGLATFIGGGPMVINAMIFTMVGDTFTVDLRFADPML